jgi:hypothetical protein
VLAPAPAPDHFPNNIGLSCKFRAGAVAKYVFSFAPKRDSTPGSCVRRFQDSERNFAAPLPRVRFGLVLKREQNFRTMCGSHSHLIQLHVVPCVANIVFLLTLL